jgi:phosphate transport system protein
MSRSGFEKDMQVLKSRLLMLGAEAERSIADGVEALKARDRVLAQSLIDRDTALNQMRYEIEEACYTLMATQQPMASDLREIVSTLLIAIELERIADHSKNLGEIVLHMGAEPLLKPLIDIPRMAAACQEMLDQALEAFSSHNPSLGRQVCDRDDELDRLYTQVFRELLSFVIEDPHVTQRAMNLLFAAHNLERIGDRITNIAERAIYAATGRLEEWNTEHPVR